MTTPDPCGCRVVTYGIGLPPFVAYCPTHSAAFENEARIQELEAQNAALLAALGRARAWLGCEDAFVAAAEGREHDQRHCTYCTDIAVVDAAITNAEEEGAEGS